MRPNVIISLGSFNAAFAIVMAAFAAHGLQQHLDAHNLQTFKTACDFHFWHALGLILIGLVAHRHVPRSCARIAWLMLAGILLFSGSLYLLSISGIRWLGWITPFGGMAFILAWLWLGVATLRVDDQG